MLEPEKRAAGPYRPLIYENTFRDPAAYENIDPSRFCVALADYDPPTIYRLWLGLGRAPSVILSAGGEAAGVEGSRAVQPWRFQAVAMGSFDSRARRRCAQG